MNEQLKYRIEIFWSEEDGGYIANIPELKYTSAFGETREEAMREVQIAEKLHLETLEEEGRPIPEPDIHDDKEDEASVVTEPTNVVWQTVLDSSFAAGIAAMASEGYTSSEPTSAEDFVEEPLAPAVDDSLLIQLSGS